MLNETERRFYTSEELKRKTAQIGLKNRELIKLKRGWSIQPVEWDSFWNLINNTKEVIQEWPIYESISTKGQYLNTGASICLIVYILSNRCKSGHFNVVAVPSEQYSIVLPQEIKDFQVYQSMLADIPQVIKNDRQAKFVLFGQHLTYLQHHVLNIEYQKWVERRNQIITDLRTAGVTLRNIIDLRGGVHGGVHTLFDSDKKTVYFAEHIPNG